MAGNKRSPGFRLRRAEDAIIDVLRIFASMPECGEWRYKDLHFIVEEILKERRKGHANH